MLTRRSLLQHSGAVLLGSRSIVQGSPGIPSQHNPETVPEDRVFASLQSALELSTSLGASYAEARFSRSVRQSLSQRMNRITGIGLSPLGDQQHIGIRVLVSGHWGHASGNQLEAKELNRLARTAVSQAKSYSKRSSRNLHLSPLADAVGRYITPGIDPFSVPLEEKIDLINSWRASVLDYRSNIYSASPEDCSMICIREEFGFANTDGARQYSVRYFTSGHLALSAKLKVGNAQTSSPSVPCSGLHYQQGGWDVVRNARPHDQIPALIEKSAQASTIGFSPVDIGRHRIVCDPATAGRLIGSTIAAAMELDRALGYEANAGGTSFLGPDPQEFLGKKIAHDLLSISGNRDTQNGLATMPWDCEGVSAEPFDLIRNGVMVDYLTDRKTAPILNDWYEEVKTKPGSNACAFVSDAGGFPITGLPNLVIKTPTGTGSEDDIVRDISNGYYLNDFKNISSSFQRSDGYAVGLGREIVGGRLGNYVALGIMFNTQEFFSNLISISNRDSAAEIPFPYRKGEPVQQGSCTIESPSVAFDNVAVIDPTRKA